MTPPVSWHWRIRKDFHKLKLTNWLHAAASFWEADSSSSVKESISDILAACVQNWANKKYSFYARGHFQSEVANEPLQRFPDFWIVSTVRKSFPGRFCTISIRTPMTCSRQWPETFRMVWFPVKSSLGAVGGFSTRKRVWKRKWTHCLTWAYWAVL